MMVEMYGNWSYVIKWVEIDAQLRRDLRQPPRFDVSLQLPPSKQSGAPFEEALFEAQKAGFAEADPTDDITGYDTRAKLVILARVALPAEITLDEVVCQPISTVDPVDFEECQKLKVSSFVSKPITFASFSKAITGLVHLPA